MKKDRSRAALQAAYSHKLWLEYEKEAKIAVEKTNGRRLTRAENIEIWGKVEAIKRKIENLPHSGY